MKKQQKVGLAVVGIIVLIIIGIANGGGKVHADQQHFTDRQRLRSCVRCRLTHRHCHIDSHSISGGHEGKGETEATQDGSAADACTDQIEEGCAATATPDNCARRCAVDANGLLPADQRGELL